MIRKDKIALMSDEGTAILDVLFEDDDRIVAGVEGIVILALSKEDERTYLLEGHSPDGTWTVLECPEGVWLYVEGDEENPTSIEDLIAFGAVEGTLRVAGIPHERGGHSLSTVRS